jgi:hypothetical protein
MNSVYDEFVVRVPIVSALPGSTGQVVIRDVPEAYVGPRGHDRLIHVSVKGQPRLHLAPEEGEALLAALVQWRERRSALRDGGR